MNQCFLSLSENCSMKWVFQYLHWTATCVQYLGTVVQALITVLRVRSQTHQVWIQRHRQWSQGVSVDLSRQDSLLLQTGFIWQEAPETSHLNHLEPRAESPYTCQHVVFSVVLHSIFFFFLINVNLTSVMLTTNSRLGGSFSGSVLLFLARTRSIDWFSKSAVTLYENNHQRLMSSLCSSYH